MMNILRRLSGFTGKDDGAHRRPTRKNTSWFNKRGEIIRERVPAYRLSEDELRDYLQKKFPRHKDFHIRLQDDNFYFEVPIKLSSQHMDEILELREGS